MSNKGSSDSQFSLNVNGSIVHDEHEVSELFNNYFNNITKPLNLFEWNSGYSTSDNDPILSVAKSILKYADHPSILKIRSKSSSIPPFTFKKITSKEVYAMILKLDCSKKTSGNISNKILRSSVSVVCPFITNLINNSIENSTFPDKLKLAEITPVPKVDDTIAKMLEILDLLVFCRLFPSYLKRFFQTS